MCGNWINSVQHSKYHGCWCPGSLRRQDISTHDIDYVEWQVLDLKNDFNFMCHINVEEWHEM